MRGSRLLWLGLLALDLAARVAFAADAKPLTLQQARETALRNHPRISEVELQALASQQVIAEVRSGFLPTVIFNSTSVGKLDSNTRIAAGGLNNPSIFDRNAEGVTISQMITDFGRTAHVLNSSRL